MTENLIQDLVNLPDEPIVSDENESILKNITAIKKTSEFEPMDLNDERLDELIECLKEQEDFAHNIEEISKELGRVPSIIMHDDDEEDDYI